MLLLNRHDSKAQHYWELDGRQVKEGSLGQEPLGANRLLWNAGIPRDFEIDCRPLFRVHVDLRYKLIQPLSPSHCRGSSSIKSSKVSSQHHITPQANPIIPSARLSSNTKPF